MEEEWIPTLVYTFTLLKGKKLASKDANGKSDPYCVIELLSKRMEPTGRKFTSEKRYKTLNPTWEEEFFKLADADLEFKYGGFRLECWDHDTVGSDDFMGCFEFSFDKITTSINEVGLQQTFVIPLEKDMKKYPKESVKGDISFQVDQKLMTGNETLFEGTFSTMKNVAKSMRAEGWRPKNPVVIIPGIYGSALEVWTGAESLFGKRIWVTIQGMGLRRLRTKKKSKKEKERESGGEHVSDSVKEKRASKLRTIFSRKKNNEENNNEENASSDKNEKIMEMITEQSESYDQATGRLWLDHMRLQDDGYSDPVGIKVRPVGGLHSIDYLCYEMSEKIGKKPSYVMAYVIKTLIDLGYDSHNLIAAPYDWRLPPSKVHDRDYYLLQLKASIEIARQRTGNRVAIFAHSMGCKMGHYFLHWAERNYGYQWIEENVEKFIASGAPWLGAPKSVRSLVTGDRMGLDFFLSESEMVNLARTFGGQAWLLPLLEANPETWSSSFCWLKNKETGEYVPIPRDEALSRGGASKPLKIWEDVYMQDPVYMQSVDGETPAALRPPPVPHLIHIYGKNLDTEVSYYFEETKHKDGNPDPVLPFKLSSSAPSDLPANLKFKNGIASETNPDHKGPCSGDGTVPYASLSYSKVWEDEIRHNFPERTVTNIEEENWEHRDMLSDANFLAKLSQCVCEFKPNIQSPYTSYSSIPNISALYSSSSNLLDLK